MVIHAGLLEFKISACHQNLLSEFGLNSVGAELWTSRISRLLF